MKYINIALVFSILFVFFGCGGSKVLTEKRNYADTSFDAGNYESALVNYEEIIRIYKENGNSDNCPVYTNAGIAAYNTGDYKKAIEYLKLDEYSNFKTGNTFYYLAKSFSKVDNLSLELLALQDYKNSYPNGEYISEVNMDLYNLYVQTDNFEKALELYPIVSAGKQDDISLLTSYFNVQNGLDNTDSCSAIARRMLDVEDDNETALLWFGKKYYRLAEDRYQDEVKAYNANKTNKQYKILLAALEVVTSDFKKSLGYFKKLYSAHPNPDYANYLSHIYNRLSDDNKSDYYKKLAGK